MQITIKNVDKNLFREFKAKAVQNGVTVGKALNSVMRNAILSKNKKKRPSLLDCKPMDFGKGSERWSEQVDEILYG